MFEKGVSGNPSGRPKGSRNKVQTEVKALIEQLITDNAESIKTDFSGLKPYAKVRMMIELLPFVVPKLTSNSHEFESLTDEQLDEIIERLKNPDQ